MSKTWSELTPTLEQSQNYKGVQHVNVEKTVKAIIELVDKDGGVELVAKEGEISRAGMIIKQVEENSKTKVTGMKTEYRTEKRQNKGE